MGYNDCLSGCRLKLPAASYGELQSHLLSFPNVELLTSDIALEELKEVVSRKFVSLKAESRKIAFQEIFKATGDIHIVSEKKSAKYLIEAATLVKGENDQKILTAVFYIKPDFFSLQATIISTQ